VRVCDRHMEERTNTYIKHNKQSSLPLTCFVGRLDQTTTENDLKQYLEDVGIKDARCAKLQAKDGRVFTTAAFRVSCRDEFRELFYNEDSWPEGAELRDWYFGTRNAAA